MGMFFLLWLIIQIPSYFINEENIKNFNKILFYFPTGIFAKTIFLLTGKMNIYQLLVNILYFLIISMFLFYTNLFIVKFNKNRDFGKSVSNQKLKKTLPTRFFGISKLSPFSIKTIIYYLRNPRRLFNTVGFLLYEIWTVYFISVKLSSFSSKDTYIGLSFIVLFQSLVIIVNNANFFSYDYSAIINYFFRPLKINTLINSKTLVINFFVMINAILLIYFAFLFKLNFFEIFFQINFLVTEYFIIMLTSILTSFYLPKVIEFYSIWGMNYPILTGIIGFILVFAFIGLNYTLLSIITSLIGEIIIILILLIINFVIVFSKDKIFFLINKLLIKQKEKIIDVCK